MGVCWPLARICRAVPSHSEKGLVHFHRVPLGRGGFFGRFSRVALRLPDYMTASAPST
jgi:hypothetical protein